MIADHADGDRGLRILAIVVAGLALLMVMASVALLLVSGPEAAHMTGDVTVDAIAVLAYLPWVAAGLLLVLRIPHLPIGWIMLLPALGTAFQSLAGRAIQFTHVVKGSPMLGTEILAVLGDALWVPGVAVGLVSLMVLYPDGRPPGTRWRWVLWISGGAAAAYILVTLFSRAPLYFLDTVDNPLGLFGDPELFEIGQTVPFLVLLFGGVPAGIAALVVRWRRGGSLEREQIKWLLWAALIQVLGIAAGIVGSELVEGPVPGGWTGAIGDIASAALPAAVFIAVSRHRLYEIDRIVSRTVAYVIVIGVLGVVYVLGLTAMTSFLPSESPLAIAASTLAVAALFNPVRKKIQGWVDRRFNRSRYDAQRVMDRFAGSLRDRVDSEEVVDGWVGVVSETMQPASVGVWVREQR